MNIVTDEIYQQLTSQYLELASQYRTAVARPVHQWNRGNCEQLTQQMNEIAMQLKRLRGQSLVSAPKQDYAGEVAA